MKEVLQSCPFSPGAKVVVKDTVKHRILPPHSQCFIAKYHGLIGPSPNMVSMELVSIKNGKRGRSRADRVVVVTTLFPIEFEKRPLKSNKYRHAPIVDIAPVIMRDGDVMNLEPIDFVGWAYAYKLCIRDIYRNTGIQGRWPAGKGQPINAFGNISERMAKRLMETLGMLSNPDFRAAFVKQLRILEAGLLVQYIIDRRILHFRERLEALAYMITTDERYGKELYNLGQLKKTYTHYKAAFEAEQDLLYSISKRKWLSLPAKKRNNIPKPQPPEKLLTVDTVLKAIKNTVKNGKKVPYDRVITNEKKQKGVAFQKAYDAGTFIIQEEA
jgi:hypothetical protein